MDSPSGNQPPKDDISYPATRMMSIADLLEMNLLETNQTRAFKTPAERKEMPPLPVDYSLNTAARASERPTSTAVASAPTVLPPPPFAFGNPNFATSNPYLNNLNNIAPPPYYDMHYYAGPPISYSPIPPQMNFNPAPPMTTYNPLIVPSATVVKPPTYIIPEVDKAFVPKEKKQRRSATVTSAAAAAAAKRVGKFHPYED